MESTISNLIFPKPAKSTYGLEREFPDARLVHIRRRGTKKFTFGYYVSQSLLNNEHNNAGTEGGGGRGRSEAHYAHPNNAGLGSMNSCNAPHRYLVLYAHPNAVDIGGMVDEASILSQKANVDVLLWEFRGYGLCDGAASERELYLDIEAAFDFVETELGVPSHQVIVMGRSIGGGPCVQLAACLPTVLNDRRLSALRRAEGLADSQRSPPMYRFNEIKSIGAASSSVSDATNHAYATSAQEHMIGSGSSPMTPSEPFRLPLAGIFLQCPFTSISDAVDSLIDAYSSTGVLAYTKSVSKSLAKRIVAERFRSIDVIPEVFCFETEYNDSTLISLGATQNKNQLVLAKRVWSDTVGNYIVPPFLAIQHGDQDTIIPYEHSVKLLKAIETRCNANNAAYEPSEAASPSSQPQLTFNASSSSSFPTRYKTVYRGENLAKLHTASEFGHNNLSIHDAAEILVAEIITKHTLMIERLMGAYRHNEQFLKLLQFPEPTFVDLDVVVKNVLPRYMIADHPFFSNVYRNEFAAYHVGEDDIEGKRLEEGVRLQRHQEHSADYEQTNGSPQDTPQEPLPGVSMPAFDAEGFAYRQHLKDQQFGGDAVDAHKKVAMQSLVSVVPHNDVGEGYNPQGFSNMVKELVSSGGAVVAGTSPLSEHTNNDTTSPPTAPSPLPLAGLSDADASIAADAGRENKAANDPEDQPIVDSTQEEQTSLAAIHLPPLSRPTLAYWTSRIVRDYLPSIGSTLLAAAESSGPAIDYFRFRSHRSGNASVPYRDATTHQHTSTPTPALLTTHTLQKELATHLTVSICAFAQHVAMRWLRMQAKRSLVQLRQRGAKTSSYGYGWGGSGGGVMSTKLDGGAPVCSAIGAGNTSPDSVNQTALPPQPSARDFIYEHLSLFGSPFGAYLQPIILGKDSNMHSGLPTTESSSTVEQNASSERNKLSGYASSGFHAVIFGSFIPDPASLSSYEASIERLSESGGAMLSRATPYKCWYTHTIANSDGNNIVDGKGAEDVAPTILSSPSSRITTTSRRMKRMAERFPRVTLAEFEVPENVLVALERFLGTLDFKAALGDSSTTQHTTSSSAWPSRRSTADLHFLEDVNSGERHIDDLCGALSVGNSLLMLSEADVDRIQIECERFVIALTQRELKAMTELVFKQPTKADHDRITKAMPLTTLILPFVNLLATPANTLLNADITKNDEVEGGGENNKDAIADAPAEADEGGYLIPSLYGPSPFIDATRIALPPTMVVRLYKTFSSDFYNTTGDLGAVLVDVKRRRHWFEQNHAMYSHSYPVGQNSEQSNKGNSASILQLEECLDSLVFDLQSALLRNVPEGYCGAVGCGRYRDADEAVCLLQELYLKTFVEAETYKLPYSPVPGELLKPNTVLRNAPTSEDEDENLVEGLSGNCRFIASIVGGSDAQRRHVLLGRAEEADAATRDALHWIMPPSNLSAATTDSNNDCSVM